MEFPLATSASTTSPSADPFILAMWLMYARAPRKAASEIDGFFDLGEIGCDHAKTWSRITPYSTAVLEPEICKCGQPGCLGHERMPGKIYVPGFTDQSELNGCQREIIVFDEPLESAILDRVLEHLTGGTI